MFSKLLQRLKKGEYVRRTIESMILTGIQEWSRWDNRPASSDSDQKEATTIITGAQESGGDSSFAHQNEAKPIEINVRTSICSVAFLADGKHVVSGGKDGKIRRWRVEDGQEAGTPMNTMNSVLDLAVSRDGKWVVSGTRSGLVTVWSARSHSKVIEWKAHKDWVRAVDLSPDGMRIATGSDDRTLCVWSPSTGQRLLDPLELDNKLAAVKFSPNGCLIATATNTVRVYDGRDGTCLSDVPVDVYSGLNQSLAWASDSKQLFALSRDGNINRLDVFTGTTLSQWAIHSSDKARCISLASNGKFIAACANSSISFWDTATREQIGSVIEHTHDVLSMAHSTNYDLVVGGDKTITLWGHLDILPSRYFDNVCVSA